MKVILTTDLLNSEFFTKLKPETQEYFEKLVLNHKVFRVVDVKETVHKQRIYVFSSGLKMPKHFTKEVRIIEEVM